MGHLDHTRTTTTWCLLLWLQRFWEQEMGKKSIECEVWKLRCLEVWWLGVFIAPTTKVAVGRGCCRWAHRTVRSATGHCPVRQPRHPTVRVRPLELWQMGPPDSPVVHRTVTVHSPVRRLAPALTLRTLFAHCSIFTGFRWSRSLRCSRCSAGTPGSPVLHRTVRWIIAEWHFQKPKGSELELIHPGAPDTVRWHTGQSGAPD
jgi:hypothetical protein